MIYKKPNGYWMIDFEDQRVGRVALSARTKKKSEANRREAALRALIDAGEVEIVRRVGKDLRIHEVQAAFDEGDLDRLRPESEVPHDLGASIDRYLLDVKGSREPGTWALYRVILRNLERRFGVRRDKAGEVTQDVPMAPITTDALTEWLREPKATNGNEPWSRRRQKVARAVVGKLWKREMARAVEWGDLHGAKPALSRNPVAAVETPKIRQTRVVFLHPSEWKTLRRTTAGNPFAAALGIGCLAGLRLMEVAHLRTGIDVVLDGPHPVIKVQPREGEYPWKPKTDRSIRDVPIGSELLAILREHVAHGFAGDRYFIHPEREDRPYGPVGMRRLARLTFTAAGIKYGREGDALTFHSLRHTFASWLAQRDVQLLKIARLLGDRVEQVSQTYAHLTPSDLDRAISILDDVIQTEREK